MSAPIEVLTVLAAVGCGLMGGVWFAFSGFVMSALARLEPADGIRAMQEINRRALRPPLMLALFGTAAACAALTVHALVTWDAHRSPWLLAAAALYLVGTVGVTRAGNVPLNVKLDRTPAHGPQAGLAWAHYERAWAAFNHVRLATSAGASAALVVALT
ncbi:anthrone oxygenase family protein [Capillimicrobium parvum]|uniref:DUF1772 domain-containing protein n=1 Tax=Capillimicrobium parvum TaxID=2884022 RepID=A0A9E6Y2E5_9ACTN|nr:anthrone oxygenase family protein [Capillimicrobium parvum]UGS38636.1 hypothetical protein DSM104329_05066 [Capillimicrobium parvum]